jgi:iron complex transport system substrate-binding protein
MYRIVVLLPFLFLLNCSGKEASPASETAEAVPDHRIVSLSGTLTELLYELGYGDQLVGVDVTSAYPVKAKQLPQLGHVSQLNVEAILATQPTIVFVDAEATDQPALQQLRNAEVEIIPIAMTGHLDNAVHVAEKLDRHLGVDAWQIERIRDQIAQDSQALAQVLSRAHETPRVLFIYARGAGRLMVAGAETEAADMIERAGGANAITSFTDFKPLTPEALVEAAPDAILMFTSGLESLDGKQGLAGIPGIRQTPAFRNDRIIAMDGHYLLGFGPRAAAAARDLAEQLHPTVTK